MTPGANAKLHAPLPNFSFEQWRTIAIVTAYKLCVTSKHDVILTFAKQLFG